LVDVGVMVSLFDTSFDDIGNEDFISVTTEEGIDAVNKSLLSTVLDEIIVACIVIWLVLVFGLLLLIDIDV
jgi:hypothetical protein